MPTVYHKRNDRGAIPSDAVYVGRPSKWGDPFVITARTSREQALAKYLDYAHAQLRNDPTWVDELRGKDLVCWCAPLPCHADILLVLANERGAP